MIAYLKGTLIHLQKEKLILDTHGVGYEVYIPSYDTLQTGSEIELWIYTHVREDTFHLYGFLLEQEKEAFMRLIKISGVGPKVALGVLSSASYKDLIQWIESEDVSRLCKLPKIGKKTASQMVLSLKGKLVSAPVVSKNSKWQQTQNEVYSALLRLGFRSVEVKPALEKVDMSKGAKEGIRHALMVLQNL